MRMRRKKWARPELSVCPYFMKDPSKNRGHWAEQFERPEQPFWLELGCGKGTYAARVAADHPEINLLAIDIKSDILAVARRNIQAVYAEAGRPVDNLRLTAYEIGSIHTLLAPEDTVQLVLYASFLRDGAEIHFKTDDDDLFRDSLEYFTQWGFPVTYVTWDLHESGRTDSPSTEHEEMFTAQGIKTKFLIARYCGEATDRQIEKMLPQYPKYAPAKVPEGVFKPEIV